MITTTQFFRRIWALVMIEQPPNFLSDPEVGLEITFLCFAQRRRDILRRLIDPLPEFPMMAPVVCIEAAWFEQNRMMRANENSGRLMRTMPISFAVAPAVFGDTLRTVAQAFQVDFSPQNRASLPIN